MFWIFLLAVWGLWLIFSPRAWLLTGDRWQIKDGHSAEPSEAYVVFCRASGVILVVAAIVFGIVSLVASRDREIRDAWDTFPDQPVLSDTIPVSAGPGAADVVGPIDGGDAIGNLSSSR